MVSKNDAKYISRRVRSSAPYVHEENDYSTLPHNLRPDRRQQYQRAVA